MGEGLSSEREMASKKPPKMPEKADEVSKGAVKARSDISAMPAILVCKKQDGNSVLLRSGCRLDIKNLRDKVKFLQALRSAAAFEEMADKLPKYVDLSKRELSAIYPGSGAHIAPLAMAARLIDKKLIDRAVFTQTDIKDERVDDLWKNLNFLAKANPDFKIEKMVKRQNATGGYAVDFRILYKGKEILITLLIRASGNDYFHKNDFKNTDLFISHDSAECDPHLAVMFMFTKYVDAVRKTKKSIPIIMENVGQYVNPDDWFMGRPLKFGLRGDLALFGKFERGSRPYGHRVMQDYKGANGEEIRAETGAPFAENAVILRPHPELLKMDPKALDVMVDITGFALNGEEDGTVSRDNLSSDKTERRYPFGHVVGYGEYLLDHMRSVGPNLERGLALRILYGTYAFNSYGIDAYLTRYYSKNPDVGTNKVFQLIDRCVAALSKEDLKYLGGNIDSLKKIVESYGKVWSEYRYVRELDAGGGLKMEADRLRKEAREIDRRVIPLSEKEKNLRKRWRELKKTEGWSKRVNGMIDEDERLLLRSNQMIAESRAKHDESDAKEKESKVKEQEVRMENERVAKRCEGLYYKFKKNEFLEAKAKFMKRGNMAFESKK
ncbi:MAG: hypothetical protein WC651_03705 [Candidatus Gracilibacteria bacterium]|jgi:hypothetical protein